MSKWIESTKLSDLKTAKQLFFVGRFGNRRNEKVAGKTALRINNSSNPNAPGN